MHRLSPLKTAQHGATLVVSLIILAVLTIIGISAMETSSFEEKMSHNMRDSYTAFEASEYALREGETWLQALVKHPNPIGVCPTFPCIIEVNPAINPADQDETWWQNNSAEIAAPVAGVTTQPRYVIEYLRFVPDSVSIQQGLPTGKYYYRVTSRGTGGTDEALVILQSTYARRF